MRTLNDEILRRFHLRRRDGLDGHRRRDPDCRGWRRGLLLYFRVESELENIEAFGRLGGATDLRDRRQSPTDRSRPAGARSRGRFEIEEDESAALRRRISTIDTRLDRWIDRLQLRGDCIGVIAATVTREQRVRDLQLLDGLLFPIGLQELVREHQADVVLLRHEVRVLLQRAERFIQVARLLHAPGVLEEVLPGVGLESLLRADLPELVVHHRASRRLAQDLVAERDGQVVEPAFGVVVDSALPDRDRFGQAPRGLEEIPEAIVERDVHRLFGTALVELNDLAVRRDGLVDLLLRLEVGRSLLQFEDVGHRGNLSAEHAT